MAGSCDHVAPRGGERILEVVEQVCEQVIARHADDVDSAGRFPAESIAALRKLGALSVLIPIELGGTGLDLATVCEICATIARRCPSTAMIFAMHQIQVAAIVSHRGCAPELDDYLRNLVREQRLIASVTSEVGVGGDLRRSMAAINLDTETFSFEKKATTISYCEYADDFLVTLRRSPEAAANDQVLVLACRGAYDLKEVGRWDTLGMRGTCSPPATIAAAGATWQIMPDSFQLIATQTMVPVSHILWSGVWFGIASDAFDRARRSVRARARKDEDALELVSARLADVANRVSGLGARIEACLRSYERLAGIKGETTTAGIADVLEFNELKLAASTEVVRIVEDAMLVIGVAAYRNGGSASLGRHLRDAHSARLMVHNDRIRMTNAELLHVYKGQSRFRGAS